MAKRKPSKPHAIKRAKQRYMADMSPADLRLLAEQCRDGKWKAVKRSGGGTEHHYVDFNGKIMLAVYSRPRDTIMTFLPIGPMWPPKRSRASVVHQ